MNNQLTLMSREENRWGWRYLLFNLVFMGPLMIGLITRIWPTIDSVTFNFIYFTCNFLVVAILFRKFWLETFRAIPGKIGTCLMMVLIGFGLIRVLDTCIGMFILRVDPDFYNVNDLGIGAMAQQNYLLMALGSCVLVPIAEEALYRGVVFGSLYRRNPVAAYGISMGLFAFIHISEYIGYFPPKTLALCFLQYLPAGLCLAGSYQLSGSILTPILLHAAVNAIGMLAMR